MDINLFFDSEQEDLAVAFCQQCPVRVDCLKFVLDYEDGNYTINGVFGGTTPDDRLAMRGQK